MMTRQNKIIITLFIIGILLIGGFSQLHFISIENNSYQLEPTGGLYEYYSNLERFQTTDYTVYIVNPHDDTYLLELGQKLIENISTEKERINSIGFYVQNLPYVSENGEYPKYPLETINEGGDCEDKAILCASILYTLGYEVALARASGHMYVMVENKPFDVTRGGYEWGEEVPGDYELLPVSPRPILFHNWSAVQVGAFFVVPLLIRGDVTISNMGTVHARGVRLVIKSGIFEVVKDLEIESFGVVTVGFSLFANGNLSTELYYRGKLVEVRE